MNTNFALLVRIFWCEAFHQLGLFSIVRLCPGLQLTNLYGPVHIGPTCAVPYEEPWASTNAFSTTALNGVTSMLLKTLLGRLSLMVTVDGLVAVADLNTPPT